MLEYWRPVDGYRWYQVSNLGNVRSLSHQVNTAHGGKRMVKGRLLMPFIVKTTGYYQVSLHRNRASVHRLVAMAFCEGYAPDLCVNHKNGVRGDNRAENLEWVTLSENIKHAYRVLGVQCKTKGKFGIDANRRTPVVSIDMRTGERKEYAAAMDAVREGFESSCICRCCKGESAYHRGRYWSYAAEKGVKLFAF